MHFQALTLTGLLLTGCFSSALSQDTLAPPRPPLSIEWKSHEGFFITSKPKAVYVRDSYSSFGELSFSLQTIGTAHWQQANNYPRIGIAAFYGNTGSRQYLGHMAGVFPYVNFPLYRSHRLRLGFRLGTGAAWVEKTFDVKTNYKNLMLSTHINSCISMLAEAEAKLSSHWAVNGGISFTHISNGLWQVPNLGLNMPALTLGVRYQMHATPAYRTVPPPAIDKKRHWQVFFTGAIKEGEWLESPHAFVSTLTIERMKYRKNGDELGAGLLLTDDPSLTKEVQNEALLRFDNSKPKLQVGLYGCYEHNIGKLTIPLQLGVYLYNNYPINPLFQVIGLRYAVATHWKAVLQLKTHMGKADHIDWGIGYRF